MGPYTEVRALEVLWHAVDKKNAETGNAYSRVVSKVLQQ